MLAYDGPRLAIGPNLVGRFFFRVPNNPARIHAVAIHKRD
jgi:hypothetical protein